MLDHLMIDLETWGTVPGSAIRSIGACFFGTNDTAMPPADTRFYRNITGSSCFLLGLTQSASTREWWSKQSAAASAAFVSPEPVHIDDAMHALFEWVRRVGPAPPALKVWSHGAAFDIPLLDVVFDKLGAKPPWDFRNVRDTRTLFDIVGLASRSSYGTAHNALDDAVAQAMDVQKCFSILKDIAMSPWKHAKLPWLNLPDAPRKVGGERNDPAMTNGGNPCSGS